MKLVAALLLSVLAACSGGGGGGGASSALTPTVQGIFTGTWASAFGPSGTLQLVILDDGHELNISGDLEGSWCADICSGKGWVDGDDIVAKLKDKLSGTRLRLTCTPFGYPDCYKISGGYSVTEGPCVGDYGSVVVTLQGPAPTVETRPADAVEISRETVGAFDVWTLRAVAR